MLSLISVILSKRSGAPQRLHSRRGWVRQGNGGIHNGHDVSLRAIAGILETTDLANLSRMVLPHGQYPPGNDGPAPANHPMHAQRRNIVTRKGSRAPGLHRMNADRNSSSRLERNSP